MSLSALGRHLHRAFPTLLTLAMAVLVIGFATAGLVA